MTQLVRYCVVMPAAGAGRRMASSDKPKQYLPLLDKTVIEWSLSTFLNDERCKAIVVVLSKEDAYWPTLALSKHNKIRITHGGAERVDSVRNGLIALQGESTAREWASEWVLVHDAARPCLQQSDVNALLDVISLDQGLSGGLLAVPVADTIKQVEQNKVINTVPRNHLWRAQTPQMFRFDVLHRALHSAHLSRVTDESSAVELLGYQPRVVPGRADNIKVTVADDLRLAEQILKSRAS